MSARRSFDLYRTERRVGHVVERVATVAVLATVAAARSVILGAGWIADHLPRQRAEQAAAADRRRVVAENRDRIDAADADLLVDAVREANHIDPDVIAEALDKAGVPR
jgi:hypothetical protein